MTRPTVERIREVRDRLLAAGSVEGADGRPRELFPIAVGPAEGSALRRWVCDEGARSTLETGLGFAVATLFICEGLVASGAAGPHVAADPYQLAAPGYEGVGLKTLEEAGLRDLVEFHAEESEIVLPRLLADGRSFDLAFLDGNHRFEGVFVDLVYAGRLLRDRAVVFVDDVQLPGVRRAVDFCLANLAWEVEEEGEEGDAHAWAVLRTSTADVFRRPFDEFVAF